MGDTVKGGKFDISESRGRSPRSMVRHPNPDGRSPTPTWYSPWINGSDITGRNRVTCGLSTSRQRTPMEEAALYEAPFEYVEERQSSPMRSIHRGLATIGPSGGFMSVQVVENCRKRR